MLYYSGCTGTVLARPHRHLLLVNPCSGCGTGNDDLDGSPDLYATAREDGGCFECVSPVNARLCRLYPLTADAIKPTAYVEETWG